MEKRNQKNWKQGSFFLRLIVILFVVISVPTVVVITLNTITMRRLSEEDITNSVTAKLQANQELCDTLLSEYIYEALDFILDKEYDMLRGILTYEELNSDYENVRMVLRMNEGMQNFVDRNNPVYSVFFYVGGADYVVATNEGIVKLFDFGDLEWLKEIRTKKRSVSGAWYSRQMITDNSEKPKEILSYVYSSNNLYTTSKVTVAINVYEEEILKLLYSKDGEMEGEGYLTDGAGNVLVHSDTAFLHQNIAESMAPILTAEEKSGVISKGTEIAVFQKSSLYDWIYVNVWSNTELFQQTAAIYRTSIIMILLFVFAGVVFAVFLSDWISKPVRKLVNQMKELNPKQAEGENSKNEMIFLSNSLEQIKERELQMENSLEKMRESVQVRALYSLMHGDAIQEEQYKNMRECFPYNHFIVCMVVMDDAVLYQSSTTHEERRIYRNMLYEQIKQSMPEDYRYMCIRYDVTRISLVMNIKDYDSDKVTAIIDTVMRQSIEFYIKNTGWSLTVGISLVHNSLEGIRVCTEEARLAAGRRLVLGKGNIIFFRKNIGTKNQIYEFQKNEKKMINYLELGESEKINNEMDMMVAGIKNTSDVSEDNVMLIFHQIAGTVLIWLNKNNYSPVEILGEQDGKIYNKLMECETIDEMKEYLNHIFERMIEYRNDEKQDLEKDNNNLHQMMRYIRKNYQEDIDFERMAELIGISYSYARKVMKASTGESLIEYLNRVRLEEAKILMEDKKMGMKEVAEAVGFHNIQSLQRAFKKYEGMAPNTYRKISGIGQNDE